MNDAEREELRALTIKTVHLYELYRGLARAQHKIGVTVGALFAVAVAGLTAAVIFAMKSFM
jgi:hypothetical protein